MDKNKFPEYEWIDKRITELDETTENLKDIAANMKDDIGLTRSNEEVMPYDIYDVMASYIIENKLNMPLYTIHFTMGDIGYRVVSNFKEELGMGVEKIIEIHPHLKKHGCVSYTHILFPSA